MAAVPPSIYTDVATGNVGIGTTAAAGRLTVAGSVGIGTTAPQTPLHIEGNLYLSGTMAAAGNLGLFRNRVINGDMRINQRGASTNLASMSATTLQTDGGTYGYVADRWCVFRAIYAAGAQFGQGTGLTYADLPYSQAGISTFARVSRISGNTGTGAILCCYALESQDSYAFAGKSATLSFYYRTGANFSAANLQAYIATGTGTDQGFQRGTGMTGLNMSANNVYSPTSSWTRVSFTRTLATNLTQVGIQIQYDPTGTAGAADYFDITGVQLEIGSIATPFEIRPYAMELGLCQRYYQIAKVSIGSYLGQYNSTYGRFDGMYVALPTEMRIAPTDVSLVIYSGSSYWVYPGVRGYSAITTSGFSFDSTVNSVKLTQTRTAGGSVPNEGSMYFYEPSFGFKCNAEL